LGDPYYRSVGNTASTPCTMKKWSEVGRPIGHRLWAPKYRGDLGCPLSGSGAKPGKDVLAFLGEDEGLQALQY
jgi:hypothetical protein